MKKIILMVLLTGAAGGSYAQNSPGGDLFEVPQSRTDRLYVINLGKGNQLQVEFSHIKEIGALKRIDSLVKVFIKDIEPLKDSLAEPLNARWLEYLVDTAGIKKIRFRQTAPATPVYILDKGEAAALKLSQDTIVITVIEKEPDRLIFYRLSFYLNRLEDLIEYPDGPLQQKILALEQDPATKYTGERPRPFRLKNDPDISSPAHYGYVNARMTTFLFRFSVDVQNYKNHFVPSASLGLIVRTRNNGVLREFGFTEENHFFFSKNSAGKPETHVNRIISLSYGRASLNKERTAGFNFYPYVSLGWLLKKRGEFFENNTIKVGAGRFTLFNGSTRIEPTFYIDNFYKRISPSLRLVQHF
ncbi:MAG TPA: hypothetical protein VK489_02585 [Ferruginibacter sp.]|nr:hypothetical protein [Ferruginibacter sp.]